jgi:DtxR family Mn-dependent transcriptional regulator
MTAEERQTALTGALEDYLETIFLEVREHGFARVRDIARARNVSSSSVTPALKRLAEMNLIDYAQREYVGLTPAGEEHARRVLAKHDLLKRFFSEVLQMSNEAAEQEACVMEHALSPEAMDRLVRFFEFMQVCPESQRQWISRFHGCSRVHQDVAPCEHQEHSIEALEADAGGRIVRLSKLTPGKEGRIRQVQAEGPVRQRLLDMGLLPEVMVQLERTAPSGDPVWISLQGSQLALRKKEADSVLVVEL